MIAIATIALMLGAFNAEAQKLKSFGAEMGKKQVGPKTVRIPYMDVTSYWGFMEPGVPADEVVDNKKLYYLYVWIPIAAPEIGVRMISPIPKKPSPAEGDIITETFTKNQKDTKTYFDTWVSFEKAVGVISKEGLVEKAQGATWRRLEYNDDSGEMPKQPSGRSYNSLLRVKTDINDPMKALVVGLYRIGFTTWKKGEVEGSFLAQLGAPIKLPGVKISPTIEGLLEE
ncbi:MAG: hypothetical protein C0599_03940 [Salinivirgaceae bacterium]|nr:MAG: hypothetical protein C0599_03940 [Salinivirgaceae bacterium]